MAIFNLTDISFGNSSSIGGTNTLVGGRYESNLFRYPIDIGSTNRGHYMVIHINVQDKSQYNYEFTSDKPTVISNITNFKTPSLGSSLSDVANNPYISQGADWVKGKVNDFFSGEKVSSALSGVASALPSWGVDALSGAAGALGSFGSEASKSYTRPGGIRTVQRVTDTIALYMPDTLNFTNDQVYTDLNVGKNPIAAAISAAGSLAKTVTPGLSAGNIGAGIVRNLTPFMLGRIANSLGDFGQSAFATMTGMVENPMLELLYVSPQFRSFRFEFMFYPRSQQEAQNVLKIINCLQFHQAPELKREFNGYYLVPPSEFDIKFYYNGQVNTNIPPISTCVLQSIDVNYAPSGFSAYEVPGQTSPSSGGTGMPVAIQLSLQFREAEIMTKANFADGREMTAETPMTPMGTDVNPYTDTTPKTYTDRFDLNGFRDDTKVGTPTSRAWARFNQNINVQIP